ncbi:MAG: bifunctional oligoribonuclease/PAP phosphatase NrnA [Firmicutes bacterium]|nr:bifunctional oligoribonuclease/PAP phosphatase NrnA [Bacillota bacterium]
MSVNSLAEIAAVLLESRTLLVSTHIQPDGDAIGSLLALGLALEKCGRQVVMYCEGGVPQRLRFLAGADKVVSSLPESDFDCVVALDCADRRRLPVADEVLRAAVLVNIDHHPTNNLFGRLNYVDAEAAATGEIIFDLLQELGVHDDCAVAEALYVAVSTDTGSFKYDNTTEKTHRVAGRLLACGVRPGRISSLVFDVKPLAFVMALRQALSTLAFSAGGRIAWLTLTEKDLWQAGADNADLEGLINYAKNIEGVEVGLLFKENDDGTVKVGFRSFQTDVAAIAAKFGGGGHARAAGCTVRGSLDEAVSRVIAAVAEVVGI